MVFCGKPSGACLACRSKRTKCDQRTPSCSQCLRAERTCSGYRDVQDLAFRDQTLAVTKKFRNQAQAGSTTPKKESHEKEQPPPPRMRAFTSLPWTLQPSIETRAMELFLSHYVLGKSRSFEYIDVFYAAPTMDDHLAICLGAVSLADFAEEVQSDDLLKKARRQYIYSLRATNLALRDKHLVTKDSTLLAILLLDLFEKITARHNPRPLASLTEHIDGATKLMIIRSKDQFHTEAGVRMFNHILYIIIMSCIIQHSNMPVDILALRDCSATLVDASHYRWRQLDQIIRYVELRADVHSGLISDHKKIMALGIQLDKDCAALAQTLEDVWHYDTCVTGDIESAYEGIYHVYDINFHQLKVWNSIRVGRIMCNAIVQEAYLDGLKLSTLSVLEISQATQFQASLNATIDTALELCRAVPQYCTCLPESHSSMYGNGIAPSVLGLSAYSHSFDSGSGSGSSSASPQAARKFTYEEQASAYAMIHPLHIAVRSSAGQIPKIRAWIVDRLRFIGTVLSMPDALMVTELIEADTEIDPWVVFIKLAGHDAPENPFDPPTSAIGARTKAGDGRNEKHEYLMLI